MKKNIFFISSTLLLSLVFSACGNLFSQQKNDFKIEISGKVESTLTGAVPSPLNEKKTASRTAFPSNVDSGYYTVKAVKGTKTIDGTYDIENSKYNIVLTEGGVWTVSVSKYLDENFEILVLSSSFETEDLPEDNATFTHDFVLKPFATTEGKGNVYLRFYFDALNPPEGNDWVPDNAKIRGMKLECDDANWTITSDDIVYDDELTDVFNESEYFQEAPEDFDYFQENYDSFYIKKENIKSGSYVLTFYFYNKEECNPSELLFTCTETINVFDNFTTNTWVNNGSDDYIDYEWDADDTIFYVQTVNQIYNFVDSIIYVDGDNGSDINDGSYFSPLKSVSTAFNKLSDYYFNSDNYNVKRGTIFLKGVSQCNDVISMRNTLKTVLVKRWPGASTAVLKSIENSGAPDSVHNILTIGSGEKISFTDIVIDGGKNPGGDNYKTKGIEISDGGSLYLNNVTVQNCEIYNAEGESNYAIKNNGILKIGGKINIEGNSVFETSTAANLFLGTGKKLDIDGLLSEGSKICVVHQNETAVTAENPFVFTNGYGLVYNQEAPSNYFSSDSGYAVGWDLTKTEASLNISSYVPNIQMHDDYEICCLKSKIINPTVCDASGRKVQFYLYDKTTGEDLTSSATWTIVPKYMGADTSDPTYSGKFCTKSGNSVTFTDKIGTGTLSISVFASINNSMVGITHMVEVVEMRTLEDLGENESPSTTETFAIATAEDINKIVNWVDVAGLTLVNVNVILENDITLENLKTQTESTYCNINIDGNGNTLRFESYVDNKPIALFYNKSTGYVKNLIIDGNAVVTANISYAPLLKNAGSVQFENCINRLNVSGNGSNCAGFVMQTLGSPSFKNCRNEGNIQAKSSAGGLIASRGGSLSNIRFENCVNTGNISGGDYVGGITGETAGGIFINCVNRGNISGKNYIGGIAGSSCTRSEDEPWVTNNANYGDITGSDRAVGGIVGYASFYIENTQIKGYCVRNNVNTGKLIVNETAETDLSGFGYIIGALTEYTVTNKIIENNFYLKQDGSSFFGVGGTTQDETSKTCAFTVAGSSSVTAVPVKIAGSALYSSDVVYLLNKWIENQADPSIYSTWFYDENGLPKLASEE